MKLEPNWLDRSLAVGPRYCLCFSKKEFKKKIKEIGEDPKNYEFISPGADATTHMTTTDEGYPVAIVCMTSKKNNSSNFALLVHEAVHIWQYHLDNIREDKASPEFEAYGIQRISHELFNELLDRRSGKRD